MRHAHGHIDAVEEWSREPTDIEMALRRSAFALVAVVAVVTARARIHGSDEHEVGRETDTLFGVGDCDLMALERLTECFEEVATKLG